ncbi:hypothetical protein DSO57_1001959 [Entomophthora muscae]|uniref:Uncharacterized protein n=1 Tax=Entomophthora muscae TaxID=34485 RepID=A0ACC2UTX7_9FUNG|nr:hypothetical protein DSO57_1001959 [Entomophthora muscae]
MLVSGIRTQSFLCGGCIHRLEDHISDPAHQLELIRVTQFTLLHKSSTKFQLLANKVMKVYMKSTSGEECAHLQRFHKFSSLGFFKSAHLPSAGLVCMAAPATLNNAYDLVTAKSETIVEHKFNEAAHTSSK